MCSIHEIPHMFMFMMNLSQLEGKLTEDSSGEFFSHSQKTYEKCLQDVGSMIRT